MEMAAINSFSELSSSDLEVVSGGDVIGVVEGAGMVVAGTGIALVSAASVPATGGLDGLAAYFGVASGVTLATAGVVQINNSL